MHWEKVETCEVRDENNFNLCNFSALLSKTLIDLAREIEVRYGYDSEVIRKVINTLTRINNFVKDDYIMRKICEIIKNCNDKLTILNLLSHLEGIFFELKDKDLIRVVLDTIGKYKDVVAEAFAFRFKDAATKLENKSSILELCRILSYPEIGRSIGKYNENNLISWDAADCLAYAASVFMDENLTIEIAKLLERYNGNAKKEIASCLRRAIFLLSDKEITREICEIIRRYDSETVEDVSFCLKNIISKLKDRERISRVVNLLKIVGKGLFYLFSDKEICAILEEDLDPIVKDRYDFEAVSVYIKSKKKLPKPTAYTIKSYEKIVKDYVKELYGIERDLNLSQILLLYSIENENKIAEIVELVNKSDEKNVKYYHLNLDKNNFFNYSRKELIKYVIIAVIGSRDKKLEKNAVKVVSELVGIKTVNKARNEFYTKYKRFLKDIVCAFKQDRFEDVIKILESTNNSSILSVLSILNYSDFTNRLKGYSVVKAVESKNPLDYDSRIQMACVYLPRSQEILNYCKDENIVLVRYDINNETLGSAICYLENNIFLVDSVEGNSRFRKADIFEVVYNDLILRAKERNVKTIVFNMNVFNRTPKDFIHYLRNKDLKEDIIKMHLRTNATLEASKKGVRGYVLYL